MDPLIAAFLASRPALRQPLPLFDGGDGRRREGPFFLEALLDHDAATDVSLTEKQAWYHDHAVRQSYAIKSTDTTEALRAILHLEAYEVLLVSGTAPDLQPAVLDNLLDHYLSVKIGEREVFLNLHDAWSQFQVPTAGTDATVTLVALNGGPVVLPSPIVIDLEEDQFSIKGDSAAGLGVDERVFVKLYGAIFPQTDPVDSNLGGAPIDVGALRQAGELESFVAATRAAKIGHMQALQRIAMIRGANNL